MTSTFSGHVERVRHMREHLTLCRDFALPRSMRIGPPWIGAAANRRLLARQPSIHIL